MFSNNNVVSGLLGLWALLWLASILAVATKRLHDLDHSGLLLVFFLAVFVALSLALRQQDRQFESIILGIGIILLGSIKGTKGANRFGADPT